MVTIALAFIDAINAHNIDKICDLMTDDHVFVDSMDNKTSGKTTMKHAWIAYFELFPGL